VRIIAGRWRGRRIEAPAGDLVRPTGDRVREAWMSIVHGSLPEARVLDLFSGSGALGLEALSRGATAVDFVETSPSSLAVLRQNVETLGAEESSAIHRVDALRFVESLPAGAYDVAFADPPYDLGLATAVAERWLATPFADVLGVEHRINERLPGDGERRKYGGTVVTIYRAHRG
jgi:16S rRNA (guanine966-N2)-methyltransferase